MEVTQVKNCFGQTINCVKNDLISELIVKDGIYEKPSIDLMISILKSIDNPIFLDVGANIGNHSLAVSNFADCVLSFEPVPFTYNLLSENIKINNIDNIQAYNVAFSDENKVTDILFNMSGNIGGSTLELPSGNNKYNTIKIKAVVGDEFLSSKKIPKVDFIKIDVEGHELHTLDGLKNTIIKNRPFIQMEWNDEKIITGFLKFFENNMNGYHIYYLSDTLKTSGFSAPFSDMRKIMKYIYANILKFKSRAFLRKEMHRSVKDVLLVPAEKNDLIDKKYFSRWVREN
ncbi:MAG: FkbM family methyltransferase [Hafnia sp.]